MQLALEAARSARRMLALTLAIVAASGLGAMAGALAALVRGAPTLDELRFDPRLTSYLYDRKGRVIARLALEHRIPVSIEEIPQAMQQAIIAVEDSDFENHHGIDLKAIARALWVDIRHGGVVQGGSTITQQLAKNAFLSHERTLGRKIREAIWAIQLERRYTKEEILEAYLNEVYFGEVGYGVEAAAQSYFGKSIRDVTLAEAALLAGLVQNPGLYSPYRHPDRALARRNFVLDRMVEVGFISPRRAQEAKAEPIRVVPPSANKRQAPYFVDEVVQQLLERYGTETVYGGGLRVYTTLDLDMQQAAEEALQRGLPDGGKDAAGLTQPQGAVVALDPHTGDVLAMVGGRGEDKYNRALLAARQPGSAIKPFIWVAALESGMTPATVVTDEPREYTLPDGSLWRPSNYDGRFRGPITLRDALEESVNLVAIQLLEQVGVGKVMDYATRMGISTLVRSGTPNDMNLAFALGGLTRGVTPIEMASAYGVLANGGIYTQPRTILRIDDASGYTLYQSTPTQRIVLPEVTAYLATDMMRGVIERGTGRRAQIGRPAAGKTGTTQDYTNGWFVGFTPDMVATVWIGNDTQTQPMIYKGNPIGSGTAAAIWGSFMRNALKEVPPRDFPRPAGIVQGVRIDVKTGLLAPAGCTLPAGEVRSEIFAEGTQPTEESPRCQQPLFQFPDWLRRPLEFLNPAR